MLKPDDRELQFFKGLIDELYDSRKACLLTIVSTPFVCVFLGLFCWAISEAPGDPILAICGLVIWVLIIVAIAQIVRIFSIDRTIWLVQRFQSHYSDKIEDDSAADDLPAPDHS